MNNIIYDDEIITPEYYTYEYYNNFPKKLNKRNCVKLALFCAKIVNPNTKESNHCIVLVEKWLKDKKSVNREELHAVAYAAYSTAYGAAAYSTAYGAYAAYAAATAAAYSTANASSVYSTAIADSTAIAVAVAVNSADSINIDDINLYLKTLLRTTKQYNTTNHNNQYYESILKQIINEDIDNLTDTDYNMLIDLSQEYYNINPHITNKRIFIELLRKEYE